MWVGLWDVLAEEPSPKFHDHPVGLPVEESVKVTVWPAVGAPGEKLKAADGADATGELDREAPPQPRSARVPITIPVITMARMECTYSPSAAVARQALIYIRCCSPQSS